MQVELYGATPLKLDTSQNLNIDLSKTQSLMPLSQRGDLNTEIWNWCEDLNKQQTLSPTRESVVYWYCKWSWSGVEMELQYWIQPHGVPLLYAYTTNPSRYQQSDTNRLQSDGLCYCRDLQNHFNYIMSRWQHYMKEYIMEVWMYVCKIVKRIRKGTC